MIKYTRALILAAALAALFSCAGPSRRDSLRMPYEDRLQLASIYVQGGQRRSAVQILEDAVLQDDRRPEAWAMLGEILYLEGDLKESARHLKRALATGGDDPVVLNNLAWVEKDQGHLEEALDLTDRALLSAPVPLYPYLDTRARVLKEMGRYEEAETDARAALSLVPEYDEKMKSQLEELLREIEEHGAGGGSDPY